MFHRLRYIIPLVALIVAAGYPIPARADEGSPSPDVQGTLGANGWYTSDVTVSWSADGVPLSECEVIIDFDTPGEEVSCGSESITIKRDATPPSLLYERVEPNPVTLNESANATAFAADSTSGTPFDTADCDQADTSAVGIHSVTCTATDYAGNSRSVTASYSVVYAFEGFFAPVDKLPTLNVAKAGRIVPLKWRLYDVHGVAASNLSSSAVKVTVATLSCSLTQTPDLLEEYGVGSSGLVSMGNGNYQFNWAVPSSYANSCKTVKLSLGEGKDGLQKDIVHSANFMFTR